jgi:hypothetical protein
MDSKISQLHIPLVIIKISFSFFVLFKAMGKGYKLNTLVNNNIFFCTLFFTVPICIFLSLSLSCSAVVSFFSLLFLFLLSLASITRYDYCLVISFIIYSLSLFYSIKHTHTHTGLRDLLYSSAGPKICFRVQSVPVGLILQPTRNKESKLKSINDSRSARLPMTYRLNRVDAIWFGSAMKYIMNKRFNLVYRL